MSILSDLATDVTRAARALAKSPGFAAAAIVTLALGIGANSAMFSVLNAVVLRPLPYRAPETRVMIWSRWADFDKTWVSDGELLDYRRLCPSLKQVAAWSTDQVNLTGDGEPLRVGSAQVTPNTFAVLGAEPLLGRSFVEQEAAGAPADVAILGFELWQSRFAGSPDAVGRSLLLDGSPHTIVGVMPPGFRLPTDFGVDATEPTAVWTPYTLDTSPGNRGNHGLYAAAELVPGATARQASAELQTVTATFTREGLYPAAMRFSALAVPIAEEVLGSVRRAVTLLFGAVTLLLLIASANVASLLLARSEVRQREMALRAALGAGRSRILRQLFAEGLVLAVPSAIAGILLAWSSLRLLGSLGVAGIPRVAEAGIDYRVLAFTIVAALGSTLLFSLAPALRALRVNLVESLREGGAQGTVGGHGMQLRGLLVAGEVALSVMLLLGAGLLLRSLWNLQRVDLGFDPRGVLTLRLSLPEVGYEEPGKVVAFYRELASQVRALPGVRKAGLMRLLPLGAPIGDWGVDVAGFVETPGNNAKGDWQVVSDDALEALGEHLVQGRTFTASDTADGEPVVLVNETMARTYWPKGDALGGRLRIGASQERPWLRVVGIMKDVRHNGVVAPIKTKFYAPHSQFHRSVGFAPRTMHLVIRTAGDPLALVGQVRSVLRRLDPSVPAAAVRPMNDVVAGSLSTSRLAGMLLALFAALAVVLSAVGIYGLLSYLVSERRQEIGIRLAIGADEGAVLRLILGQGLRLTLAGLAAGWLAALALARVVSSLLHDVTPHDTATFMVAPLVLLAAALFASYLPAHRASRVDPVAALRSE
jgi:putative ABC transport system permease protein